MIFSGTSGSGTLDYMVTYGNTADGLGAWSKSYAYFVGVNPDEVSIGTNSGVVSHLGSGTGTFTGWGSDYPVGLFAEALVPEIPEPSSILLTAALAGASLLYRHC